MPTFQKAQKLMPAFYNNTSPKKELMTSEGTIVSQLPNGIIQESTRKQLS